MRSFALALACVLGVSLAHAAPPVPTSGPKAVKPKAKPSPVPAVPLERPGPPTTGKTAGVLIAEISALEQQLGIMKQTDPKHAVVLMRLAADYGELAGLKAQAFDAASSKDDKAKARAIHEKSRDRTYALYRQTIEQHDDYAKLDESLYFLARGWESFHVFDPSDATELKQKRSANEKALATYLELIKKRPLSAFVPWAYVAYGDLYFDEAAAGKVQWNLPLEAYKRVLTTDATKQPWGYAQFRLGFVHWNLEDATSAKAAFEQAESFGSKYPTVVGSTELVAESQKAKKAL